MNGWIVKIKCYTTVTTTTLLLVKHMKDYPLCPPKSLEWNEKTEVTY